MNLKELIEEIVERVSYYQMGKQEQWTGEYTHFMSPAQATTDILKAMTKHLCDKVDGMKNPRLFKDIDIPRATKFFNLALDEVKQMLRKEMG